MRREWYLNHSTLPKKHLGLVSKMFFVVRETNVVPPLCRVMSPWANNLLSSRPHPVDGGGRREREDAKQF